PVSSTLSLHDALPISGRQLFSGIECCTNALRQGRRYSLPQFPRFLPDLLLLAHVAIDQFRIFADKSDSALRVFQRQGRIALDDQDRKSTRLNSSHLVI